MSGEIAWGLGSSDEIARARWSSDETPGAEADPGPADYWNGRAGRAVAR